MRALDISWVKPRQVVQKLLGGLVLVHIVSTLINLVVIIVIAIAAVVISTVAVIFVVFIVAIDIAILSVKVIVLSTEGWRKRPSSEGEKRL